jgi:hypothetical protein
MCRSLKEKIEKFNKKSGHMQIWHGKNFSKEKCWRDSKMAARGRKQKVSLL